VAGYEVQTISVDERPTALGSAGPYTLVVDRPAEAGGGGQGFSGGQLLNLAVADASRTTCSEKRLVRGSPYGESE
jgi:hypothetical protein